MIMNMKTAYHDPLCAIYICYAICTECEQETYISHYFFLEYVALIEANCPSFLQHGWVKFNIASARGTVF